MDKQTVIEAMQLIIGRSPSAYREAAKTIQAANANSSILQLRVNNAVEMALSDPQAEFNANERQFLADVMGGVDADNRPTSIRFDIQQRLLIQDAADGLGISFSAFVSLAAVEKATRVYGSEAE